MLIAVSFWLAIHQLCPGQDPKLDELKTKAQVFVDLLGKGDYAKATKDFDAVMQKVMPADKLGETWKGLLAKVGAFKKREGIRMVHKGKFEIALVTCVFEKVSLDARVVFNSYKQITGLFFAPVQKAVDYHAPDYVNRAAFHESTVTVGSGEWALPGTLARPVGTGPFPAVVLVHGSGPHDRDETIGPNLPFRDLAWGLASQGVAVLRYEKRTKEHAGQFAAAIKTMTIKEEVIDDTLAAVALLRKTEGIDPKRIFVLGHSLGGMCAPDIGARDPGIAGLICLAGSARPFEDVLLDQLDYILSLSKDSPESEKKEIEKLRQQALAVKGKKVADDTPAGELPLGVQPVYWRSLQACHPAEVAAALAMPMLILQGERDYQVTMDDFRLWKKTLASRKNVTFTSYPRLNHLFMDGEGKARPAEYEKTGHVAREVIDDIAQWVKRQ
jgi:dienelactone hydrolase